MLRKVLKCQYGPTNSFFISSPLGRLMLVSCPNGLHSLSLPETLTDDQFCPDASAEVAIEEQLYQDNGYTYKPTLKCVEWLQKYFQGKATDSKDLPPFCAQGCGHGSFTSKVWHTLAEKVTFGQTVSYKQLAGICGNEKASRAVGQAMRNNPLVLVVPCHRVILSSGALGNYSSGKMNSVKAWLLKHEGVDCTKLI